MDGNGEWMVKAHKHIYTRVEREQIDRQEIDKMAAIQNKGYRK